MFARRDGGKTPLHRSSLTRRDHDGSDNNIILSGVERKELGAQKFDEWVRFKDSFDRGLTLFAKLDPSHCEDEKAWQRVAVNLAAIDRSLGIDLKVTISRGKRQGSTKVKKAGPRSMFDAFKKWTMFGHMFSFVKLTTAEVESLGAATRQFLEPDGKRGGALVVLPSLKYNFPPPPARRGLRTRPLTDDQRALNVIFLRRVRAGWGAATREMRDQLAKYVEEAELTYQAKRRKALAPVGDPVSGSLSRARPAGGGSKKPARKNRETKEGEEKRDFEEEGKEDSDSEEGKDDDEAQSKNGVKHSGATRLREEDSDDDMDGQGDIAGASQPRLDSYGLEGDHDKDLRARRARFVDAGLRAIGIRRLGELLEEDVDKRKKREKDDRLEKQEEARRAHEGWTRVKDTRRFRLPDEEPFHPGGVWKPPRFDFSGGKGLVRPNKTHIATTTLDIMWGQGLKYVHAITDGRGGVEGDLEKSKRKIKRYKETVVQERKRRVAARQAENAEAFQEWTRFKDVKEAAVRCLRAIDPPEKNGKPGASERWLEIGRALKGVDVRLLAEWTAWTGASFPATHCQAVWDALSPKSCDTHSTSYSATRETFLKLLRPGVDYREAFFKVVRRRLRRGGSRIDDDEEVENKDLFVTRRELRLLLTKELGIILRSEEMRLLVDAFTKNEDRRIRWEEFESLTGGVRGALGGDSAKRLERRCVWETTCPVTGMPNAFTVCAVKETDRARPNTNEFASSEWRDKSDIINLPSGGQRRRSEIADRSRRLRIMCKYGLAPAGGKGERRGKGRGRGGTAARGEYDGDDFEPEDDPYGDDDFERSGDDGRKSPGRKSGGGRWAVCESSEWNMSKRMAGLNTLKRLSKDNREADELRQLLAEGTAPSPPKFWSAKPGHPDVGEDNDALKEELLLCWRPQPGAAVAFFSLEMSGPEGSKMFCRGSYREIWRDPPDAEGNPQYQYWVRGLSPNTRYGFRVRALNGFGPGAYAHGCFATRPAQPARPVAIRATPTEIFLKWVFGSKHATKLRELRLVFDALDEHDDGEISRDELLAALDLDHPHLMAMLKASPAAISTDGKGGIAADAVSASVLDALEANDEEFVFWEEVEHHFDHANSVASDTENASGDGLVQTGRGKCGGGHFLLERCTSQENDKWKEVWKGTTGTARVKALDPGLAYRFRVHAVNCEGLAGTVSKPVIAHTLLAVPPSLRVNGVSSRGTEGGVWDNRVRLRWDTAIGGSLTAPSGGGDKSVGILSNAGGGGGAGPMIDKTAARILMQWANEASEDNGVNVEMAFSRFDRDRRGAIEPVELGNLLEALGIEVTEERLREAFTELNRGGDDNSFKDGLSLDDFEAWWNSNVTTFALLRDDGVAGNLLEVAATPGDPLKQQHFAPTNVTSFKGRGHGCEVAGLTPNTLYRFRVRAVNNRTRSSLSAPLAVMTAPRQPDPPVIVRCQQRSIVVRWYPGAGGACKYILQARLVEGLDGIGALTEAKRASSGVAVRRKAWGVAIREDNKCWVTVYEGVDTTAKATGLATNSVYRFKVRGVNSRGVASAWSFPAQAATSQRGGGAADRTTLLFKPQCAAEIFHLDADDDIVVGDTIIFTERLYVDTHGDPIPRLTGPAGIGNGTITPVHQGPSPPSRNVLAASSRATNGTPHEGFGTASVKSGVMGINSDEGNRWAVRVQRGRSAPVRLASTAAGGGAEFVGERTAAAHVLQDSFRSMKKKAEKGVLEYSRETSRSRVLRLEIVWSTVSREEADAFALPRGSIVERSQGRLSEFETFRAPWEQEERRKSVREEWVLLSGV